MIKKLKNRLNKLSTASYLTTLFYLEIIFFMYTVSFLSGKRVAIICGIIFSILLTIQVIQLYSGKNRARIAELLFLDVHLAYILIFTLNLISDGLLVLSDNILIYFRTLFIIVDIALILILTDNNIISFFHKKDPIS